MTILAIKVPNMGDFTDIPVIEILVKPGDVIAKEQALVVLESDKATMEVPSDVAGKVVSVEVAVGDQLSIGSVILMLETDTSSTTTSNQQEVNLSVVPQGATTQSLPQKQVTPTALKASAQCSDFSSFCHTS